MAWLLVLLLVCARLAAPQSSVLPVKETLRYNVEWRLITAGKGSLQWSSSTLRERTGWQANLHLESVGLVSKLYKVEYDYSANYNQALCAQSLLTASHESNRRRETKVTFDAESKKASYQ